MQRIIEKFTEEEDIIDEIVRRYPDVNERRDVINRPREIGIHGLTILTFAVSRIDFKGKLVRFLLQSGADPNWITEAGYSHVLSFCASDAALLNMTTLLAYGADPNTITNRRSSLLYQCAYHHKTREAHLLLVHGARLNDFDLASLRHSDKSMKIISDFYDDISLHRMAIHYIRLDQIRTGNRHDKEYEDP